MNEHQNKSLARTNFGIEILNSHPTTLRLLIIWETISNIRESVSSVKQCFLYTLDPLLVFFFFGYPIKHSFSCVIYRCRVSGYQMKHSLSCLMSLLGVWLSGETLILICGISFLNVWISNKSLLPTFEYTTPQSCDTRQNTLSRVWYSISQSLDIGWNTLFSVFGYKKRLQDNTLDLPGERKNVLYVGK